MESGRKLSLPSHHHASIIKIYEIRFHNDTVNDLMRSTGRTKVWNSYPADVVEKVMYEHYLLPKFYYYSTFDVDTNELIFLSQDNRPIKKITQIRWKINKWFIKRGW